jgi:hypothetical protein
MRRNESPTNLSGYGTISRCRCGVPPWWRRPSAYACLTLMKRRWSVSSSPRRSPGRLATATLAAQLADLDGAAQVLAEPTRMIH